MDTRQIIAACIEGGNIEDASVRSALESESIADGVDKDVVYLTLLACFVLEEGYIDNEDEWQMIVVKAKKFLEKSGVKKPAALIKMFTLAVIF